MVLRMVVLMCGLVSMPAYGMSLINEPQPLPGWDTCQEFQRVKEVSELYARNCYHPKPAEGNLKELEPVFADEGEFSFSVNGAQKTVSTKEAIIELYRRNWFNVSSRLTGFTRIKNQSDTFNATGEDALIHTAWIGTGYRMVEAAPDGSYYTTEGDVHFSLGGEGKIIALSLALQRTRIDVDAERAKFHESRCQQLAGHIQLYMQLQPRTGSAEVEFAQFHAQELANHVRSHGGCQALE